jgi:hypothetical protein
MISMAGFNKYLLVQALSICFALFRKLRGPFALDHELRDQALFTITNCMVLLLLIAICVVKLCLRSRIAWIPPPGPRTRPPPRFRARPRAPSPPLPDPSLPGRPAGPSRAIPRSLPACPPPSQHSYTYIVSCMHSQIVSVVDMVTHGLADVCSSPKNVWGVLLQF